MLAGAFTGAAEAIGKLGANTDYLKSRHDTLSAELQVTRDRLDAFLGRSFWGRLRWLVTGR